MHPKKQPKIAPFLNKLYDILSTDANSSIIKWNNAGNGFIILNYNEFCSFILSKHFKTNIFSSFVRQLNLYNFHKVKPETGEYEFVNRFFDKNNRNALNLIKRKNKQEIELKGNEIELKSAIVPTENQKPKKLDLEGIKAQTKNITTQLNALQRRVETLEGKHDFLEYCHSELGERNKKIKAQLSGLIEKQKTLESLFLWVIKNKFPNLKIIDNSLPDKNSNNEQIVDISKNEIITQIYKKIQVYCLRNNIDVSNIDSFLSEANRSMLSQMIDVVSQKNNNNLEIQNEINYFSQVKDFQEKYLSDLDENLNAARAVAENSENCLGKKTERSLIDKNLSEDSDGLRDLM